MVVITYPRPTDKKTKKKKKRVIERLKKCLHQRVSLSVCTVCTWREVTFLPANQPTRQAFSPSLEVLLLLLTMAQRYPGDTEERLEEAAAAIAPQWIGSGDWLLLLLLKVTLR